MATRVADIDITQPLPMIELRPDETGLFALVRRHGRPRGLLRLSACEGAISPEALRVALASYLPAHTDDAPLLWQAEMPLSIVVCTHERPDDLRRCLDALLPLAAQGHEVIVIDNAPRTTRTRDVAAAYPFRYLCEPRQGLDNARNCGLRSATHPIVAYTDDDAAPDINWARAIAAPFVDPSVGCVTGLVLPVELETPAQEQFEIYCANRRTFVRRVFVASEIPPAAGGVAGMGANMAVRRELTLRLGGFDPRLDGGTPTESGGDTDMFARILASGAQIVYTPDALVWHRHRREMAQLRRCIFGYGVGLYSFLTKRLLEQCDREALVIGVRWLLGPLIKACWNKLRGRLTVSPILLLLEVAGACLGPLRLWQAMVKERRLYHKEVAESNVGKELEGLGGHTTSVCNATSQCRRAAQ
jgi:GT2 family glycosyltransferase